MPVTPLRPGTAKPFKGLSRRPARMQGAVAIEFALIFSLLFALFYAIVSYALPLLMLQTFNAASAEGVRVAVKVILDEEDEDACPADYIAQVETDAKAEAEARLAWMLPLMHNVSGEPVNATVDGNCVLTVRITYPDYLDNPPIPVLTLPVIGDIPRLPNELASEATIRL